MVTTKNQDGMHSKLTRLLADLCAQTSNVQEAINALLKQSVILPTKLIGQIEDFIAEQKELDLLSKKTL